MGSFSKWGKSTKAQGSLTATDTSATSATDPTSPPGQSKCVSEPKVQPLETEYYDLLQVDTQATAAQIKSQYYKLAMKYHPDKNPDESGQEMFKRISAAYQVLSDPTRRKRYDKSGAPRSATPSDSLMTFDEFIIKCLDDHLCNKVFDDIIGRNPCVQALKEELEKERDEAKAIAGADAIEKAGDEAKGDADSVSKPIPLKNPFKLKSAAERTAAKEKRDAEKAAKIAEKEKQAAKKKGDKAKLDGFKQADKERIATQAKNLTNKLSFFTNTECDDQAAEAFREKMALEAQELRNAYHGAEHLHAIGYIYSYKARQYLRQKEGWALQSFASSVQDTGHQAKEVYDMVKSGDDINRFCKRMEKVANEELDEESLEDKYQELAEMAVQIFPKAFWRLSKLDIEDVLRKVCDEVLRGKGIDPTLGRNRAKALKILGDVYQRVAPDTNQLILRPTSKP